jgi:hypothetical protein
MVSMWLPPDIVDLTAKTPVAYRKSQRLASNVFAVVLHQTAMHRGSVAENYLKVNAHYVVMPNGQILLLHGHEWYLAASNAFNEDSVAVEFVGNFPDDKGNYWRGDTFGRHKPTTQQVSSGRDLLRHMKENLGISDVYAHRQGYMEWPRTTPAGQKPINERGNCPGPDIWSQIGEWAVQTLGMDDGGKGFTQGDGSPIPDSWRKKRA